MIRVTLELVPGGIGEPELLGTINIGNKLARTRTNPRRGDYSYDLFKKRGGPCCSGQVDDYPRLSYHCWNLVRAILNDAAAKNGGRI